MAVAACLPGDAAARAAYVAAMRTAAGSAGGSEASSLAARAAAALRSLASAAIGGASLGTVGGWGTTNDAGSSFGGSRSGGGRGPSTALRLVDATGVVLPSADMWALAEPGTVLLTEAVRVASHSLSSSSSSVYIEREAGRPA